MKINDLPVASPKVNGGWASWSSYGACSVSCDGGVQTRERSCTNPAPKDGGQNCLGLSTSSRSCNIIGCPVDGKWSAWSSYRECSVTCGGGTQQNTRSCTNPAPKHNGKMCTGPSTSMQKCNTQPCPIDGGWASWSGYGACSATCGGGVRKKSRTCTNPSPSNDGNPCSGPQTSSQDCNLHGCPVDGGWGAWSQYDTCSVTCDGGKQSRYRTCDQPSPAFGGKQCAGLSIAEQTCNIHTCPIDGGWTSWSQYGDCDATCGGGTQGRSRSCTNPAPKHGGKDCPGSGSLTRSCNTHECPVDGGWTPWFPSQCSETCGGGEVEEFRTCTNPTPEHGGKYCTGPSSAIHSCNTEICPTDGDWTSWSDYGVCSATCGGGTKERSRSCTNPAPQDDGSNCKGLSVSSQNCNNNKCPIDGGWTEWLKLDDCTVSCGGGKQKLYRSCSKPVPNYGGKSCTGPSSSLLSCNTHNCPTDGNWASWSEYGDCSVTCGGGSQERTRSCTNPAPKDDGEDCPGSSVSLRSCKTYGCPIDAGWSEWSSYSSCSVSCDGGKQTRYRSCSNPPPHYGGKPCKGPSTEVKDCNTQACPTDGNWASWFDYGDCSLSCGGGTQKRTRTCTNPAPKDGGKTCLGKSVSSRSCNTNECPVDGVWSVWSEFDTCTVTCGGGKQTRHRSCSNPPPHYGGTPCRGSSSEVEDCNTQTCPIDGHWASWSPYGSCSLTCGGGIKKRSRTCTKPEPKDGGEDCPGCRFFTQSCNTNGCPVDGAWSGWSPFDACTVTCGGGEKTRHRCCSNPPPAYGGKPCPGHSTSVQSCNTDKCP